MEHVDIFAELRKALNTEKEFHGQERGDASAFAYAYTAGYQAALQYMGQDIDLIEKMVKKSLPAIMISAEEMAELIKVNMQLKEKDEAADPNTPGYVIACEELLAYM